jgi:hypothetical protein
MNASASVVLFATPFACEFADSLPSPFDVAEGVYSVAPSAG